MPLRQQVFGLQPTIGIWEDRAWDWGNKKTVHIPKLVLFTSYGIYFEKFEVEKLQMEIRQILTKWHYWHKNYNSS